MSIVAWVVALLVSTTCSFFILLYGLQYGYRKSVKWFLAFFSSFLLSASVVQPIKVLVITALFTLIFKSPLEIENRVKDVPLGKCPFKI